MPAIKSILVPIDFSTVAANAFNYALHLADRYPARIDLLYVMPTALSSPGMDRILAARAGELKKEAIEKMVSFRSKGIDNAMNTLTGIPEVCVFIEAGDLGPIVKKRIKAGKTDLIIMGTTGREKPLSGLIGTNTTHLIDETKVPVLIIPNEARTRKPGRLCYATDLKHLDPFRVTELFDFFGPFAPNVDFVHVSSVSHEKTEFDLDLLRKVLDQPDIHERLNFTQISGKNKVDELLRYAKKSAADIIVMNRPRRGWLERLWKRSHTQEAIVKTELPLLIFQADETAGTSGILRSEEESLTLKS
ncbi:universal stress protein [Neolewinella agarilytica]|uniref:Nucleotide-binding universal stress protein, UspA family n=1 Tax=Neolewinella agarilytica TaxID=478744 RepID=A0A1H9KXU0_9BACT|nr:universal stress protein [Neolewinella agarilytica]SER03593.1 Nucleotide-binding universal stress protein, UspA family [Neolewinella agarilytica]